jgi:endogenous inhibitor of DNA gyrase (YacG/DUF329 family)
MSLPLDSDGFLRRECPTCERQFKWLISASEEDVAPVPEGGYFCPYCALQASADMWWTPAQLELATSIATQEVVKPELEKFARNIRDMSRHSGGFISADVKTDLPPEADPLVEVDDMRRVDFPCHPNEPVKVLDTWAGEVHCLICGSPVDVSG